MAVILEHGSAFKGNLICPECKSKSTKTCISYTDKNICVYDYGESLYKTFVQTYEIATCGMCGCKWYLNSDDDDED